MEKHSKLEDIFGETRGEAVARIIVGIGIFLLATFVQTSLWDAADYRATGFPMAYHEAWGPCPPGDVCEEFNPWALAFDLIFWYLITCAVLFRYGKRQNRS